MGSDKSCYCLRLVQAQLARLVRRYYGQLARQKETYAGISATPADMLSSTSNEGGLARPLNCCRKKTAGAKLLY